MFLETVALALQALRRNKGRSFLTSLGIIIGVTSVILLVSIGSGIQTYITQQFEDLGSNLLFVMPGKMQFRDSREGGPPGVSNNQLTLKLANNLEKKAKHIRRTLPIMNTNATVKYRNRTYSTFVIGTTENYQHIRNSPAKQGKFFTRNQVANARKVALLGQTVIDELFPHTSPLGKSILINQKKYQVIGTLGQKGAGLGNDQDNAVLVPITTLQRQTGSDKLSYIYLEAENSQVIDQASREAKKILLKTLEEDEFSILDQKELLSTVTQILSVLTAALGGIAAISLVVGGIGIMNIMLVSVTERTREIGLRKAVGATSQNILTQFLIEAIVLSLAGGAIGILLGSAGSLFLRHFIHTSVTWWSVLLAFGVSSLVGIVFGTAPAIRASRLDPITALRYE